MLFLGDEVQTMGLTGSMWGFQAMDVVPDMFAFGKKTQSAASPRNDRILRCPRSLAIRPGSTRRGAGNLVDMVRARRYLEIIAEENLVENARVVAPS